MKTDFLAFVALLLLVHHTTCETCPHPEDISGCSCKNRGQFSDMHVTCAGGNLSTIEEAFHNLNGKKIESLTLTGLRNVRLPSTLFWGLHVKDLIIRKCDLKGVADFDRKPAFLGLEKSLETLKISESIKGANRLETLNLAHLVHLRKLHLAENNIPKLGNDWFQNGPNSLTIIDIDSCGISVLEDRAFESLTNIYDLDMRFNRFKTFARSMLPTPARSLTLIRFSDSDLHGLPVDAFSEMPSMKQIYLYSNNITRLPSTTWSGVWNQLDVLNLEGNPLQCDQHIEWIFDKQIPDTLHGNCTSPPARKNVSLEELIKKNQNKSSMFKGMKESSGIPV